MADDASSVPGGLDDGDSGEYHASCSICFCAVYELPMAPWLRFECDHFVGAFENRRDDQPERETYGILDAYEDPIDGFEYWGERIHASLQSMFPDDTMETMGPERWGEITRAAFAQGPPPQWWRYLVENIDDLDNPLSATCALVADAIRGTDGVKLGSGGENWGMGATVWPTYVWAPNPAQAWKDIAQALDDLALSLTTLEPSVSAAVRRSSH